MENIRPIRNEDDYDWALAEIECYFDAAPEPGSPDADRFDVLTDLIEAYENRHWPIDALDPVDALVCFMKDTGRSQAELARLLGSASRASEILNRKRALTVAMIHRLSTEWKIPTGVLVRPYAVADVQTGAEKGRAAR
jgi:HTH-type transcriptional regulator/antitoxin HigA